MRILVLGAGALGGYFGARLVQAGGDVTFLLRLGRAAQLARDGLVVESPLGDARLDVPVVTEAGPGFDLVLLTCKAYDLDAAIESVRPAVAAGAAVLPVLNGLSHLDRLRAAFGAEAVLGGLAKIQATLAPDGTIRHLGAWSYLTYGEPDGRPSARTEALHALASRAPGMTAELAPDILARMWEKLVHLGTVAAGTVLFRASVGEIARAPGGTALMRRLLHRNIAIAAAEGFPVREGFQAEYDALMADTASAYTASMLRDLEAGGRTEAEHVLGFLLDAARRAGIPDELHEAALVHARAYEQRREAGRLPGGHQP